MFKFSNRSIHYMTGVDPQIKLVFMEAIQFTPIDFGIPPNGGVRFAATQNKLFMQKKSGCDGYNRISNHQIREGEDFGQALDFYAYVNGAASWERRHLSMVAGVILSTAKRLLTEGKIDIELTWGGQFGSSTLSGWDMPHIERSKQ